MRKEESPLLNAPQTIEKVPEKTGGPSGALKLLCASSVALILQSIPTLACAGGEGLEVPEALDHKVDVQDLGGVNLFFANAYNENLWLYAIYCTVLMAAVGILIGFFTDLILKAFGMEVEKIEHQE